MKPLSTPSSPGFTLIEMLITLSMFSLLMSVLLAGLFATTGAWRRADAGLVRSSQLRHALNQLVWDLEHLHFEPEPEEPVFQVGRDEHGRAVITASVMDERPYRGLPGAVAQVLWELKEENEGLNWTRTVQFHIASRPTGDPVQEVILYGVEKVEYRFFGSRGWSEQWELEQGLPQAVQARVRMAGTPLTIQWGVAQLAIGAPR